MHCAQILQSYVGNLYCDLKPSHPCSQSWLQSALAVVGGGKAGPSSLKELLAVKVQTVSCEAGEA